MPAEHILIVGAPDACLLGVTYGTLVPHDTRALVAHASPEAREQLRELSGTDGDSGRAAVQGFCAGGFLRAQD
jgi:hypothetical protein